MERTMKAGSMLVLPAGLRRCWVKVVPLMSATPLAKLAVVVRVRRHKSRRVMEYICELVGKSRTKG